MQNINMNTKPNAKQNKDIKSLEMHTFVPKMQAKPHKNSSQIRHLSTLFSFLQEKKLTIDQISKLLIGMLNW